MKKKKRRQTGAGQQENEKTRKTRTDESKANGTFSWFCARSPLLRPYDDDDNDDDDFQASYPCGKYLYLTYVYYISEGGRHSVMATRRPPPLHPRNQKL